MCRKKFQITATAFDKKGKVIGYGVNSYRVSHPLMKHFSTLVGAHENKIYKHAELVAVLSSGRKQVHKILVQRFKENGEPANAKPCEVCEAMLKAFGVKIVQHTSDDGLEEYLV